MKTSTICSALLIFVVAVLFSSPSSVIAGKMERLAALALVLKSLGGQKGGGGGMHPMMMGMHGMGGFPGKIMPIPIQGMKPKKCKEKVKIIVIQGKHHGLNNFHGGNAFVEYPSESEIFSSHLGKDYPKISYGGTEPVFKVATIGGSYGGSGGGQQSQHVGSWSSQHYGGQAQSSGSLSGMDFSSGSHSSGGLSSSGSSQSPRIVYINDYKGQATKMLYQKHLEDTQGKWDDQL